MWSGFFDCFVWCLPEFNTFKDSFGYKSFTFSLHTGAKNKLTHIRTHAYLYTNFHTRHIHIQHHTQCECNSFCCCCLFSLSSIQSFVELSTASVQQFLWTPSVEKLWQYRESERCENKCKDFSRMLRILRISRRNRLFEFDLYERELLCCTYVNCSLFIDNRISTYIIHSTQTYWEARQCDDAPIAFFMGMGTVPHSWWPIYGTVPLLEHSLDVQEITDGNSAPMNNISVCLNTFFK